MSSSRNTPASPETQPDHVRDELHQHDITHQGETLDAPANPDSGDGHMGATEENVTPINPPTDGPANVTEASKKVKEAEAEIDPADELTPG